MELGEVYLENGDISHEKLFYYHFRKIANSDGFRNVEGNEIINAIQKLYPSNIKEIYERELFDEVNMKYIQIERLMILFSEEILISNANNLDYFHGEKRILTDEMFKELIAKFKY